VHFPVPCSCWPRLGDIFLPTHVTPSDHASCAPCPIPPSNPI
jgi:hypothetical protein